MIRTRTRPVSRPRSRPCPGPCVSPSPRTSTRFDRSTQTGTCSWMRPPSPPVLRVFRHRRLPRNAKCLARLSWRSFSTRRAPTTCNGVRTRHPSSERGFVIVRRGSWRRESRWSSCSSQRSSASGTCANDASRGRAARGDGRVATSSGPTSSASSSRARHSSAESIAYTALCCARACFCHLLRPRFPRRVRAQDLWSPCSCRCPSLSPRPHPSPPTRPRPRPPLHLHLHLHLHRPWGR